MKQLLLDVNSVVDRCIERAVHQYVKTHPEIEVDKQIDHKRLIRLANVHHQANNQQSDAKPMRMP